MQTNMGTVLIMCNFSAILAGIIADPAQSLFTYGADGSWDTFYQPDYTPAFEVEFSNPELEEEARAICGSDDLCLFDVAATGDINIGVATKESGEEQETITELFTTSKVMLPYVVTYNCTSYFKTTGCHSKLYHSSHIKGTDSAKLYDNVNQLIVLGIQQLMQISFVYTYLLTTSYTKRWIFTR